MLASLSTLPCSLRGHCLYCTWLCHQVGRKRWKRDKAKKRDLHILHRARRMRRIRHFALIISKRVQNPQLPALRQILAPLQGCLTLATGSPTCCQLQAQVMGPKGWRWSYGRRISNDFKRMSKHVKTAHQTSPNIPHLCDIWPIVADLCWPLLTPMGRGHHIFASAQSGMVDSKAKNPRRASRA